MGSRRQHNRVKCDLPITLMDRSGSFYDAILDNISIGGALLVVKDGIPNSLNDGDECNLMLHHETAMKYSFRVIRHDSESAGITCSQQEFNSFLPRILPELGPYIF
jgi:c-di-GMP-binding flagellar brake protein YcgR